MRCSWCGLPLNLLAGVEPPRCRKCNRIVCDPILRDCGLEHWKGFHTPRKVKDIEGPGLDRLTPSEKSAHAEGQW